MLQSIPPARVGNVQTRCSLLRERQLALVAVPSSMNRPEGAMYNGRSIKFQRLLGLRQQHPHPPESAISVQPCASTEEQERTDNSSPLSPTPKAPYVRIGGRVEGTGEGQI
jgi:hypothetical protein